MSLSKVADDVESREDFVDFVLMLRADFVQNKEEWENPTLDRYLDAITSWLEDIDAYYKDTGGQMPQPSWQLFANILHAARDHE